MEKKFDNLEQVREIVEAKLNELGVYRNKLRQELEKIEYILEQADAGHDDLDLALGYINDAIDKLSEQV